MKFGRFFALLVVAGGWAAGPRECRGDGAKPSVWVYRSASGNLLYGMDAQGVRVNDFSDCGYKRGLAEPPNVTNVVDFSRWFFLSPRGGTLDDGAPINAALAQVSGLTLNSNGFRGVVYLGPGNYRISPATAINITNSGVVLKGSGAGTTLTGQTSAFTMISVHGSGDQTWGPTVTWMNEVFVPAGSRTFRVDNAGAFQAGDPVVVVHPTTDNWWHAMDMDQLAKDPWGAGNYEGHYERTLTRIEGNWVTVDTPLPQSFDATYGGGLMYSTVEQTRYQNCGVEDLVCVTDYGTEEETTPNSAVRLLEVKDCWVRRFTAQGYFSSAVSVGAWAKYITISECTNMTPDSSNIHFRYSFYLEKSDQPQFVLMRDCYSAHSRHSFTLGSMVPGPNAFVRCDAGYSDDETGPHERWSTGTLFDNVQELGGQLLTLNTHEIEACNRGNSGGGTSAQGWTGGYTVMWNCFAKEGFRVRNPPTARNWLIGSSGELKESRRGCWYSGIPWAPDGDCWAVGQDPPGTYDQSSQDAPPVQLHSLYFAQLQQRMKVQGSEYREYRLGDIDQFHSDLSDFDIPGDTNWLAQIRAIASPAAVLSAFDIMDPNLWTAFTFKFPIGSLDRIVAASLSLALKAGSGQHHVYLDSTQSQAFSELGWNPGSDGTLYPTIELQTENLLDGQLNVALDGNCAVDFAVLNLQVAPAQATAAGVWSPEDTYVRGGSYADQNFSKETELVVKNDNDAVFTRRSYLRWDLTELNAANIVDAKVRLYCQGAGQAGNENSVAVVAAANWSPATVTWNTQPSVFPPFAYVVPESGNWVEISVLPQLMTALGQTPRQLGLCLDSPNDWGSSGDVSYLSTKTSDQNYWPQLVVATANAAPSLAVPGRQTTTQGGVIGPLAVTIGDVETPAANLVLTGTSSTPSVVADSGIIFGGSGSNRTVTIHTSVAHAGTAIITLSVSDGTQTTSASFTVVAGCATLSPPAISPIANKTMNEDGSLSVAYGIGAQCTVPDNLSVRITSTNHALFPAGSLVTPPYDSSGNRTLILQPAADQNGVSQINILVSDGVFSTNRTFLVTVLPVADAPAYARITSPLSGQNFLPSAPLAITGDAYDVETNLSRLEFYRGPNQLLGIDTNAPYSITWSNPPAGTATLYAIAYDQTGLSATSPPVTVTFSTPVVPRPQLFIGQFTSQVAVTWLDTGGSNWLQTATNLTAPTQWTSITNRVVPGEGAWFYFPTNRDPKRFFRLKE